MKRVLLTSSFLLAALAVFAEVHLKLGARQMIERETMKCYETDAVVNGKPCTLEVGVRDRELGTKMPTFTVKGLDREAAGNPTWPAAMPVFAGGIPSFSAELTRTRTALVTVDTPMNPSAALNDARAAFGAAGWSEGVSSESMTIFSKDNATAAVSVELTASGVRITAMQRLGAF